MTSLTTCNRLNCIGDIVYGKMTSACGQHFRQNSHRNMGYHPLVTGTSPTADYVVFKDSFVVARSITSVIFAKNSTDATENRVDAYGFATVGGVKSYSGPASNSLYVSPLDLIVSNV